MIMFLGMDILMVFIWKVAIKPKGSFFFRNSHFELMFCANDNFVNIGLQIHDALGVT